MRTLHVGLRVADLERSLYFYAGLGYEVLGNVPETEFGSLTMLKLPGDEFVTLELVHDPRGGMVGPGGLNHLVIQVKSMQATVCRLTDEGSRWKPPVHRTAPRSSGPRGSPTPTAIGSSWCSGPPGTLTA
jgi:lactoylglutathione lyase